MLVEAARQRGFEVTKLDFGPAGEVDSQAGPSPDNSIEANPSAGSSESNSGPYGILAQVNPSQKLIQAKAASVIHVQLPGLVWNLERRIQFQDELDVGSGVPRGDLD